VSDDTRWDNLFGPFGAWLAGFGTDFGALIADSRLPAAFVVAIIATAGLTLIGGLASAAVRIPPADASTAERLGLGLVTGTLLVASWTATAMSAGRSSFAPVGVGFAVVLAVAAARDRRAFLGRARAWVAGLEWRTVFVSLAICAAALIAISVVYGTTIAPSPRDGVQPLDFADSAYYSVLSRDLARTGIESGYSPSGFDVIPGLAPQFWYHWGELWLAAGLIEGLGLDATVARHFVVLPVLVIAVAWMVGCTTQRLLGRDRWSDFVLGAAGSVLLAPLPTHAATYFGSVARGSLFGITTYGLGLLVVAVTLYLIVTSTKDRAERDAFTGVTAATLLPAHIALAMVTLAASLLLGALVVARQWWRRRRIEVDRRVWRISAAAFLAVAATVIWGTITGHGLAGGETFGAPFGLRWLDTVLLVALGGGVFLVLPIALVVARGSRPVLAASAAALITIILVGAVAWGYTVVEFNSFHLFIGPIVAFSAPVVVAAYRDVVERTRGRGYRALAATLMALLVAQLGLGSVTAVARLEDLGPGEKPAIPIPVLEAIRALPVDAKIAYRCDPLGEYAIWNPELLGIALHADRPMVAMCFQVDVTPAFYGLPVSADRMSRYFRRAPQRSLYPSIDAAPTDDAVRELLDDYGIAYLYADPDHPNLLSSGVQLVYAFEGFTISRVVD